MKTVFVVNEVYNEDVGQHELSLVFRINCTETPGIGTDELAIEQFDEWVDTYYATQREGNIWVDHTTGKDMEVTKLLCARHVRNGLVAKIGVGMAHHIIKRAVANGMTPVLPSRQAHADTDWKFSMATQIWQLNVNLATVSLGRVEVKSKK